VTTDEYVHRVEFCLGDLPWRQRRELVAEMQQHLAELPPGTDLSAKLGQPEEYAADMRAAAHLERRRGVVAFLRARRPRNVVFAVTVLTIAGLAIASVAWILSYQPLTFGNAYQPPIGTDVGFKGDSVDFHEGSPFILGMEIVNTGRFAVRVLGVPIESDLGWTARLFMSQPNYTGATSASVPFDPFDLKPGERVFLALKGVWKCPAGRASPGVSSELNDFPVRFSFLWRTATADIALPSPLEIVMPKGCP
jgi:hypothetical protein